MKVVARRFIGRFGNQMFQYAFARAYADSIGATLQTEPWVGEDIFQISHQRISQELPVVSDSELVLGDADIRIEGYSQLSRCAIYTEEQARSWFVLKPWVSDLLKKHVPVGNCSHRRTGDYVAAPYPIVSVKSYQDAWRQYGFDDMPFVEEHSGNIVDGLPEFLPDFYRLCVAPVMFRANSTYSWWAGVLNTGQVFSPEVCGLPYNIEHDNVPFRRGNYARICDLHMVEDICLKIA